MNDMDVHKIFPGISASLQNIIQARTALFFKSCEEKNISLVNLRLDQTDFRIQFLKAMLFSEFIAARLIKSPEILKDLIESNDLFQRYSQEIYSKKLARAVSGLKGEQPVREVLLETKLYESVRIAWRDLNGLADLEETLEDLSCLADACIQTALDPVYENFCERYGYPADRNRNRQEMIIFGMGKLGAHELNFSSDIDLIFVYPEAGITTGENPISNEEFFIRVCRKFLKMFDAASLEFTFYRVDTRLRPFGDGGPLVMSSAAFEAYYEAQGREWERYAMIKARPVAGDIQAGYRLLKRLNPFVYRRYFDYGTFDSFRDMKARITLQVKNQKLKSNIKLGPGGIREIEFFGQIFQLIRGGVEPDLQQHKILKVLDALRVHSCINQETRSDLARAYVFLRQVENRLQEYADLQTHDLPEDNIQKEILALSMGYDSPASFFRDLNTHMSRVHGHFNQLLVSEESRSKDQETEHLKQLWMNINDPQFEAESLEVEGFSDSKAVLKSLKVLMEHPNTQRLTSNGRKKLGRLVPLLIRKMKTCENPEEVLNRLVDLIITIERRTCYLSLLLENTGAFDNLIKLASKSQWILSFLSNHPVLLDELLNPASLYSPPGKKALRAEIESRLSQIPLTDFEYLLEELSVFKQINTLRVAAADISGNYPLMKVSDHLTYIAEIVLEKVLEISWNTVVQKYGLPGEIPGESLDTCGFAIVVYGKVGGLEMGYKSDIDLVFLHKGLPGMTGGRKSIDNNMFYSNLGQRIINALTMHTSAGTLYKADMRLRPGGTSGMIVSHIEAFEEYLETQAWTWEHQALIRARPVCGDQALQQKFKEIRHRILRKKRDDTLLKTEVSDMRERLRNQHIKTDKEYFDIKQGKGGVVDIEFLVQYLILENAAQYPELTEWTDNIRLVESLQAEGILSAATGESIQQAYLVMRKVIHRMNLMEKPLMVPKDMFSDINEMIQNLYETHLKNGI